MAETATPIDMPGAVTEAQGTEVAGKPASQTAVTPTEGALSNDERAELLRLREVHKDEQKWRRQATNDHSDAESYRKLIEGIGVDPTKRKEFDAQAEFSALNQKIENAERERIRADVARVEGVNPKYARGDTEAEMRASAQEYKADIAAEVEKRKPAAPSAAPASEVTSNGKVEGPKQITSRDDLKAMTAKQIIEAREKGQLDDLQSGKST